MGIHNKKFEKSRYFEYRAKNPQVKGLITPNDSKLEEFNKITVGGGREGGLLKVYTGF